MIWMIPLAMAAAGALADKKNPLRGAAIGAGIGMTGGAAAGGLLGAGAAAGAGGAAGGGLLGGAAATGAATAGAGAAAGGSYAAGALGTAGGYGGLGAATVMPGATAGSGALGGMAGFANTLKPYGEAIGAASKVQGLLSGPEQPYNPAQSSAPQAGNPLGAQTLAQIYQQGAQISPEEQARMQRKTMWG